MPTTYTVLVSITLQEPLDGERAEKALCDAIERGIETQVDCDLVVALRPVEGVHARDALPPPVG